MKLIISLFAIAISLTAAVSHIPVKRAKKVQSKALKSDVIEEPKLEAMDASEALHYYEIIDKKINKAHSYLKEVKQIIALKSDSLKARDGIIKRVVKQLKKDD